MTAMARVKVKLFATVREAAGTASVCLEAEDASEILDLLKERFGLSISRLLEDLDSDPDRIVILINGRNPGRVRSLSKRLSDGDEVAIFPPVSGG